MCRNRDPKQGDSLSCCPAEGDDDDRDPKQGDSLSCCPAEGDDDDLESVATPSSSNSDKRAWQLAQAVQHRVWENMN